MNRVAVKAAGILFLIGMWGAGVAPVMAGNRVMVEGQVQELSELNQQLLNQESEISKDGQLELKAHVKYDKNGTADMKVYSRKFSTIDEKPINLEGKQTQVPSE